ncbi:HAD family hydrolase [Flavilitoribacter nigricans]|uniref:phosphoglycolate phosphatase n=1 Tax=Flavilitoribacter nigricans (strain ATCC 23147 / DSM 23189 / NBRC 102662 / NCIMB 1420 / SS-2) TaxID=1122177 RepID=A0A2D0N023_FLAN2|nr:HAD-IA family hydrolase [Flavilitoribacter nigricans]PHN01499.1 haloacid dehalogenase [Flavilitoribacter nigricans DSM 23189 = NBRC 102662]
MKKFIDSNLIFFWDFDGVILDSNKIRDIGFQRVLTEYPAQQVEELLKFHKLNGGLSRYVKFRYFFEKIRNEKLGEVKLLELCESFSEIMRKILNDESLLIQPTIKFIKENYSFFPMHIVSGSDQDELRYLCNSLDISKYFVSINGSPVPKIELVRNILNSFDYQKSNCVLIGDSINDYEAAISNEIFFLGYNNPSVEKLTTLEMKIF